MSAHCNDCGSDLVYGTGEDWQLMTCPVCELRSELEAARQERDRAVAALEQIEDLVYTARRPDCHGTGRSS